ncbi:MAG TPA: MBOAT family O-acyltransferase [Candidatus Hydrogenedentes bacterium]|nr:MBOAT family O-acyltransferase [Candidatus Hydrogenedentota bacterium]HQH51933.1 MBOAT family O-acyltransferase [Candidatus Hydrogenedentota bacterium]
MIQSGIFWLVVLSSAVVFWVLPQRFRTVFLAIVSMGYLAWLAPFSVLGLVVWTLAFYYLAPLAATGGARGRWLLPVLILAILGYLAYFKYIPPLVAALSPDPVEKQFIVPLGISYFTFKFIHYAIETARGNIKHRSLPDFFCYTFLFPTFTAGPIERFDHFIENREESWQPQSMAEGLTRIIHGLAKKLVIAEMFLKPFLRGMTPTSFLLRLDILPVYKVWGYLVLTFLIYYMDFSAYSDIAIGISRLFGIKIMENFNFPIIAPNISNFWKRWHMTLSGWCQTYVYMPVIGLTRNPYLATLASFLVMGLWHSGTLTRVGWGTYQAAGVAVYMTWTRIKRSKRWRFLDRGPWPYLGIPITMLFVASSTAFLVIEYQFPVYEAFRILARLVFLHLPS